jgi:hypothetical protein
MKNLLYCITVFLASSCLLFSAPEKKGKKSTSPSVTTTIGTSESIAMDFFVSRPLRDKIHKGSGVIDILKNVTPEDLKKYFCESNGILFIGVDVNEEASGNESARSVGVALSEVILTVVTTDGSFSFRNFGTSTTAAIKENGSPIAKRFYTLFGDIGSNEIAGKKVAGDDVMWINDVFFTGDVISATLYVFLVDTGKKPKTPNEQFFDYSNGYEELSILNATDAIKIEERRTGIDRAPCGVETTEGETVVDIIEQHKCPRTWCAWQKKWGLIGADPLATGDGNPDLNLISYAFCRSPFDGEGSAFCLVSSSDETKVDAVFTAPNGGAVDVLYDIQYFVGTPESGTWETLALPDTEAETQPTTGKVVYRLKDVGGLLNSPDRGIMRLRVILDLNRNGQQDTGEVSAVTDNVGWIRSDIIPTIRTLNNPFLPCPTYIGIVKEVNGLDISFRGKDRVDIGKLMNVNNFYYLEVVDGEYQGQRFDVDGGVINKVSVPFDSNLFSELRPYNTWVGLPPDITGSKVVIRKHRKLKDLIDPKDFQLTGVKIWMNMNNIWTLIVPNMAGNWVLSSDPTVIMDGQVIPPGQGVSIEGKQARPKMLFGKIRMNDFVRPLMQGLNQVGGGYPFEESPNMRWMTKPLNDFTPSSSFARADKIMVWRGDSPATYGQHVYNNFFYADRFVSSSVYWRWCRSGDASQTRQENTKLFLPDRTTIIESQFNNLPNYKMPAYWRNVP